MKTDDPQMLYVAADPAQPGAAWAACADDPRWEKHTADDIAEWESQGAIVMRVPVAEAIKMLNVWCSVHGKRFLVPHNGPRIKK